MLYFLLVLIISEAVIIILFFLFLYAPIKENEIIGIIDTKKKNEFGKKFMYTDFLKDINEKRLGIAGAK